MAKLTDVIKGFECCREHDIGACCECPYDGAHCASNLREDALALLKEQVPRILTWGEIVRSIEIESPAIWVEDRDKIHVIPALTIISCVTSFEYATFVMRGKRVNVKHIDYGKRWRAWTSRPTEEQRKAAAWDE